MNPTRKVSTRSGIAACTVGESERTNGYCCSQVHVTNRAAGYTHKYLHTENKTKQSQNEVMISCVLWEETNQRIMSTGLNPKLKRKAWE